MRILIVAAIAGAFAFQMHQSASQTAGDSPVETSGPVETSAAQKGQAVAKEATPEAKPEATPEAQKSSRWNIPLKTAGGSQLWTDYRCRDGWRVQQHALTSHWRLLDKKNVRRAWGNKEQCIAALDDASPIVPPTENAKPRHYVVLIHGLMRTSNSMNALAASFHEAEFEDVIRYSYSSSRRSISDHAAALQEVLEDLPSDANFSFVGHSMGCIVVRRLVGDLEREDPKDIRSRCKSMVMLGPPNQGAAIARRLAPTGLYGLVTGAGGLELGPQWDAFVKTLSTPKFPFAIIAGDLSESRIQNPLIDRTGDYLVTVDEAKLEGSKEFHTLPVVHSFLMTDEKSKELTVKFIKANR